MSPQIGARVSDDLNQRIETFADENNCSKSEAVRRLIEQGFENIDLETENRRLKDQLAATNQRIDETNDLVEYVEEERSLKRESKQRRKYSVFRRGWWWLAGEPDSLDATRDGET